MPTVLPLPEGRTVFSLSAADASAEEGPLDKVGFDFLRAIFRESRWSSAAATLIMPPFWDDAAPGDESAFDTHGVDAICSTRRRLETDGSSVIAPIHSAAVDEPAASLRGTLRCLFDGECPDEGKLDAADCCTLSEPTEPDGVESRCD